MNNQISIAFIAVFLTACVPATKSLIGETPAIIETTATLTSLPLSTLTPTSTPREFLISYTYYSDGGDELYTCLQGVAKPLFILYKDGELIVLRDGYKKTILSQDEVNQLMKNISETGLFEYSESEYPEGREELILNGKRYHLAYDTPHSDPLWKTLDIILKFQPDDLGPYIPDSLVLEIYRIKDLELVKDYLPQPTPEFQNWKISPLHQFGEGRKVISSNDVQSVMEQFSNFPDLRIFKEDDKYYAAFICGDFSQ